MPSLPAPTAWLDLRFYHCDPGQSWLIRCPVGFLWGFREDADMLIVGRYLLEGQVRLLNAFIGSLPPSIATGWLSIKHLEVLL